MPVVAPLAMTKAQSGMLTDLPISTNITNAIVVFMDINYKSRTMGYFAVLPTDAKV